MRSLVLLLGLFGVSTATAETWLRFVHDGAETYGRVVAGTGENVGDRVEVVRGAPWDNPAPTGEVVQRAAIKALAATTPKNVLGGAFNFRSHLQGRAAPTKPEFFWKTPGSLIPDGAPIVLPTDATDAHFEAELVIVIGRTISNANLEEAELAIFGYAVGNDVTERTWAKSDVQWWRAKASRTFGPVGPEIVTGLDWRTLRIRGLHNGKVVQDEAASDLVFSPAQMVREASRYVTLSPGDLVFTGSPGATFALKPGDTFRVEIDGIGSVTSPVVSE
jgi:2-keto-4-pentenoate hydratase/2-oxohepta-3-ene-1,7-dioic acid hydratase in catechol pathway